MVVFRQISKTKEEEIANKLEIIKQTVQEVIQITKIKNKISKKITQKYLEQLDQQILHIQLECRLKILEEIQNYEREQRESNIFYSTRKCKVLIQFLITFKVQVQLNLRIIKILLIKLKLNSNFYGRKIHKNNQDNMKVQYYNQFLLKFQCRSLIDFESMNLRLYNLEFLVILQSINYITCTLNEYQSNELKAMKQLFKDYIFISEKDKFYKDFFITNINKLSPLENAEQQKEKIYDLFYSELTQTQFMIFDNSQKNQRYHQIFHQNYKNKLKMLKSQKMSNIINLNDWFEYAVKFILIKKTEIADYFKKQYKKDLIFYINTNLRDLTEIHNYLCSLKLLNVSYNEQQLQILISEISFSHKNLQLLQIFMEKFQMISDEQK